MNILKYKDFDKAINGKSIVYVPIISCINRETGEYDLSCDGNVNRFITTFSKCDSFKKLDIVLPSKHVEGSESLLEKFASLYNIDLHYMESFGVHAGEQRNMDSVVDGVYEYISNIDCDMYIFESQKLGKKLIENMHGKEFVFYNPVSKVTGKTRIFLEGYDEINNWLFEHSNYMIVSSPDQLKYFDNGLNDHIVYLDKLIDRDIKLFKYTPNEKIKNELDTFNGKIFYLPYRLTDGGYKFDMVLKTLRAEYMKDNNIAIYYTDPNNSKTLEYINLKDDWKPCFKKVSTDRDTYYTFIDNKNVIIPYYEDLSFINHASIHEFMNSKSKCKVWVMPNENPYDIMNCPRISVHFKKPTLIIIEGQDQTGKDTLLDNVCKTTRSIYRYKQETHEDTGTDYREKYGYEAWLKNYISNQLDELIAIGTTSSMIAMTRLLVSDNVYSDLFGRDHIVETNFKSKIYDNFEVKTFCILWKSYEDYLKRISEYTDEVEYGREEFEKTKKLYEKYVDSNDIIYIDSELSREDLAEIFYKHLNLNLKY